MDEPTANDDFADLLVALNEQKVQYLVVGAHALAVHGVPRATGDFDVFVRPSTANSKRVVRALEQFGAPLSAHGVSARDFAVAGTVYQIGLPPRRIDLMTEISGVAFSEAWANRTRAKLGDHEANVIGRDALLKNKRAAGRDKDLLDVKILEARAPR